MQTFSLSVGGHAVGGRGGGRGGGGGGGGGGGLSLLLNFQKGVT